MKKKGKKKKERDEGIKQRWCREKIQKNKKRKRREKRLKKAPSH